MDSHHSLSQLLARGPVRRRDHPELTGTIDRALRNGMITAVLPGTYVPHELNGEVDLLLSAAMTWAPEAVVTRRLAAARQFWPELDHDAIELAVPRNRIPRAAGFRFTRRRIPAELVGSYRRVRFTRPALTAVDLCPELGPEVIDRVLRSRKVTPDGLRRALQLCPQRNGNDARRAQILDSRGNPWSYAERRIHRLLRDAGITGWLGNPKLWIAEQVYYPDVLFDATRLVIEVDGLQHALDAKVHQHDLWRMNDFALAGYVMLRYTLPDIERRPAMVVRDIRAMQRELSEPSKRR